MSLVEAARGVTHEIVIVSQKYSLDIKELPLNNGFKILSFPNLLGIAAARNEGLRNVSGKYVCFLDDDVKVDESYFLNVLESFNENPLAVAVIGSILVANNPNSKLFDKFNRASITKLSKYQMWRLSNGTSISYIRRDIYFDERLGVGNYFGAFEDTDFLLKISNYGDIIFNKECTVFHPDIDDALLNNSGRKISYSRGLSGCLMKNPSLAGLSFFIASLSKNILTAIYYLHKLRLKDSILSLYLIIVKVQSCFSWAVRYYK
jgi:GT2 family glycosyltransferase